MPIYYMNDYQSTRAGERRPIEVSVNTLELWCWWWWSPSSLQHCAAVVNEKNIKNKNKNKIRKKCSLAGLTLIHWTSRAGGAGDHRW